MAVLRLAAFTALDGFFPLMRRSVLAGRPNVHAVGHRSLAAFTCSSQYQLAFKFGETAQDVHHEATLRRRGVRPCVRGVELEAGTSLRDGVLASSANRAVIAPTGRGG